jgi:hypothetical protein
MSATQNAAYEGAIQGIFDGRSIQGLDLAADYAVQIAGANAFAVQLEAVFVAASTSVTTVDEQVLLAGICAAACEGRPFTDGTLTLPNTYFDLATSILELYSLAVDDLGSGIPVGAGATGSTGATGVGATGATGSPGATGAVGATGAGGGGGSVAYGVAYGASSTSIGADADVVFDLGATPYPNSGFTTVPSPGGSAFVVGITGDYEYNFYVTGTHAADATVPLVFEIYVNGASVARNYQSIGALNPTLQQSIVGQGIIHLSATDVVTLHNRTNTVTDAITVTNPAAGGSDAGSCNRSLSLILLAASG